MECNHKFLSLIKKIWKNEARVFAISWIAASIFRVFPRERIFSCAKLKLKRVSFLEEMIYSRRTKAIATIKSERSIFSPVNSAAKTKNKNKIILIDRNIARASSSFYQRHSLHTNFEKACLFIRNKR